jgi:hypothetical protein
VCQKPAARPYDVLCPRSMNGSSRPGGSLASPRPHIARPASVGSSCLHAWERTVHVQHSTCALSPVLRLADSDTDRIITARHRRLRLKKPIESSGGNCDALMDGSCIGLQTHTGALHCSVFTESALAREMIKKFKLVSWQHPVFSGPLIIAWALLRS